MKLHWLCLLLLLAPMSVPGQDFDEDVKEETAWSKITEWLSPRRNPYRTTVSDIVERGRRSLFLPPPIEKPVADPDPKEKILTGPAARRFMLTIERDLDRLQSSLREQKWGNAVSEGRQLINTLEEHRLDDEHQLRRNEVLMEVRRMIDEAANALENEGMKGVERDLNLAKSAFTARDWKGVREAEIRISAFVDSWEFRQPENARQAADWRKEARDLVRRVVIHEEFARIQFKVGFLIVSDAGPSTIVLNGKSVKEGESFGPELKIKDITKKRILFIYKGEEIPWSLETP